MQGPKLRKLIGKENRFRSEPLNERLFNILFTYKSSSAMKIKSAFTN